MLKRFTLIVSFILMISLTNATPIDTVKVKPFDRQTVVTNPAEGQNAYMKWGIFPERKRPIRKIIMKVTMGCPDSMRCADWDYMDRISLRRTGGVNGVDENYELGRMLTPYGGAFGKNWSFTWEEDVTDFSLLLRDSVEIEYRHSGYEPNEDRGWAVSIEFNIITGVPDRVPVAIQKLYDGTFPYGNDKDPITNYLKPVRIEKRENADIGIIRIIQTGHGMDKPDGCGEFCDKYRQVFVAGKMIDQRQMWKKCGSNPLYPQAGTWPIDRANWCPGDLVTPDRYRIKLAGDQEFQIRMEDYVAEKPSATEVISAYLIQYERARKENFVSLEKIIAPSNNEMFARINPASFGASVEVKNQGVKTIRSLDFEYQTNGFSAKTYHWTGEIAPFSTKKIELPGIVEAKSGSNDFSTSIKKVNGKKDKYNSDNYLHSPFVKAPVTDSVLILYFRTNKRPDQNSYELKNDKGEVLYQRTGEELKPETEYRDTFRLRKGAYAFTLIDSGGNGLEFWFASREGSGIAYLLNADQKMVKAFESDFGNFQKYHFYVGDRADPLPANEYSIVLFPTRTNSSTSLDFFSNEKKDVKVQLISDPGAEVVEAHYYKDLKQGRFTYNLSQYPPGRFFLKVLIEGKEVFTKRVRYGE